MPKYAFPDQIVVRPGECRIVCRMVEAATSRFVSYNIGSCIAVTVHAPGKHAAGLLRFALPDSKLQPAEAEERPWLFADTALRRLFAELSELGLKREDLSVRIVGGAFLPDAPETHSIARKNQLALRIVLWREGIIADGEDLGGTLNRSLWFESSSGRLIVRTGTTLPTESSGSGKGLGSCHLAS